MRSYRNFCCRRSVLLQVLTAAALMRAGAGVGDPLDRLAERTGLANNCGPGST